MAIMTQEFIPIKLAEWETHNPITDQQLADVSLVSNVSTKRELEHLNESNILEVLELRDGISIASRSHVGRITLGPLEITVYPKIAGMPLLCLLRYAYGLRNLKLFSPVGYGAEVDMFQDLLISQLTSEAFEIVSRGLHRKYLSVHRELSSPKGRIDFQGIARKGGFIEPELPCYCNPRLENCLPNQVLLGGLRLGERIASSISIKTEVRQVSQLLENSVEQIKLDQSKMRQLGRETNRLIASYLPSFTIIKLLMSSEGISLEKPGQVITLKGFMFDMNLFFQALILRFLKENLKDYTVIDQRALKGMMSYVPEYNPRRKTSPKPRPDYTIIKGSKLISILDAKYCDLSEKDLPVEWLYQLAIYALSQDFGGHATILYPTMNADAKEARIQITDPVRGAYRAQVIIRPVKVKYLSELLVEKSKPLAKKELTKYAISLAFG
jgi:5-methylcytosine-specific restriction enzyme subunit McrC